MNSSVAQACVAAANSSTRPVLAKAAAAYVGKLQLTRCCCRLYETVKQINKLEAGMRALSDEQLQVRKQSRLVLLTAWPRQSPHDRCLHGCVFMSSLQVASAQTS
jgi:hypothetical protein